MKLALAPTALILLAATAHAGASNTRLACSSESGKTIISGFLPGDGEEDIALNVSVGASFLVFNNGEGMNDTTKAAVNLDPKKQSVAIEVAGPSGKIQLRSGITKAQLKLTNNGVTGTFVGELTGTNPESYQPIKEAIKVRCFVDDQI